MRLLIKLFVVLAVLWCGWWALASAGMSRGIDAWVASTAGAGWDTDLQSTQGGFPFNISTKVTSLDMENTRTGAAISVEDATINARTYWPGHVNITLPTAPIIFSGPTGEAAITAQDATAKMRLRPGLAFELRQSHVQSNAWVLTSGREEVLAGAGFGLRVDQVQKGDGQYDVSFSVDDLAVSDVARQMFRLPSSLPATFEIFEAVGSVTFAEPLGRDTRKAPPQITQISIDGADIIWGAIALQAEGMLDVDASGVPTGEVELQAKDWRSLLDLAQTAGILPASRRGQAELMFGLVASRGGSADDLDLTLEFANGRMAISGIPLGSAPRFVFSPYLQ